MSSENDNDPGQAFDLGGDSVTVFRFHVDGNHWTEDENGNLLSGERPEWWDRRFEIGATMSVKLV